MKKLTLALFIVFQAYCLSQILKLDYALDFNDIIEPGLNEVSTFQEHKEQFQLGYDLNVVFRSEDSQPLTLEQLCAIKGIAKKIAFNFPGIRNIDTPLFTESYLKTKDRLTLVNKISADCQQKIIQPSFPEEKDPIYGLWTLEESMCSPQIVSTVF